MKPETKSNIKAFIGLIICFAVLVGLGLVLFTAGKSVISDFQSTSTPTTHTISKDTHDHS